MSLAITNKLAELSARIKYDIDKHSIEKWYEPYRWHLGASIIGNECNRYIWYGFRWCNEPLNMQVLQPKDFANQARMHRLFQRGHNEENIYKFYLEGIGFKVWTHDENGKQFRVSALNGHYGGSCDGVAQFPEWYNYEQAGLSKYILLEFKTNNTGKSWEELETKGLQIAKTQHYMQASAYGLEMKLSHVLYMNTNKNDDSMFVDVDKLNWNMAEQMKKKAEKIINAQSAPPKLSEDPTYYKCKFCDFFQICHNKKPIAVNCRSCKNAKPVEQGEWKCSKFDSVIPRDVVPTRLPCHEPIA